MNHRTITAASLGSSAFRVAYGIKYAYVTGAMYKGIASKELVLAMGEAGLIGYLGTGGLRLPEIETALDHIQRHLPAGKSYGMNLLHNMEQPEVEEATVDLYLHRNVRLVEAAAYVNITPSLVRFRLKGLARDGNGNVVAPNRLLAKVSRPEVATAFMEPPPAQIVGALREAGRLTAAEAELSRHIPMAHEICVESDSGGHTDQGIALALLPAMLLLRDRMMAKHGYAERISVGAAGGIGTPHAAAAVFAMGADFILTGSINQCTVEAGTSDAVKDLLQEIDVQDTAYAPAGDMFELGAKVQVARRGVFFPARANKLFELYQRHGSLEEIEPKTRQQIQERYFGRSFEEVWQETRSYLLRTQPGKLQDIERHPKQKMAAIFKWYFTHTTRLALQGVADRRVDYQIHCGPALGAFNQWVSGTPLQSWRNRHVADLAERLMPAAAQLLNERIAAWQAQC